MVRHPLDRPPHSENPFRRIAIAAEPEDISDAIVIEDIAPGRADHPGFGRSRSAPPPFPADRRWLKGLGIALAAVAALFALRVPLVAALPQKGLSAEVQQLAFQRVHSETLVKNGVRTLVVEGELINNSDADVAVPAIRVSLRSPAGAEVYSWLVEPTKAGLGAGRFVRVPQRRFDAAGRCQPGHAQARGAREPDHRDALMPRVRGRTIRVLFDAETIAARNREIAGEIAQRATAICWSSPSSRAASSSPPTCCGRCTMPACRPRSSSSRCRATAPARRRRARSGWCATSKATCRAATCCSSTTSWNPAGRSPLRAS